jgi:uncharacterized protein DUF3179
VWSAILNGKQLHFHLAGINNQNFLMKDEQTGTVWQQVSGKAVFGPLKGLQLTRIFVDELTYSQWQKENPAGRVLKPDPEIASKDLYEKENWEDGIAKLPLVINPSNALQPRAIVVGVQIGDISKAYPLTALSADRPILDRVGASKIFIAMAQDKKSIRVFDASNHDLYAKPGFDKFVDAATGSEWDFTGIAVSGPVEGNRLREIQWLKDYWFDWKNYHPNTSIYAITARAPRTPS